VGGGGLESSGYLSTIKAFLGGDCAWG